MTPPSPDLFVTSLRAGGNAHIYTPLGEELEAFAQAVREQLGLPVDEFRARLNRGELACTHIVAALAVDLRFWDAACEEEV